MMFTSTTTIHPSYIEHSTESTFHHHNIPLLSHLDTNNTRMVSVDCLTSYLSSLGVYDSSSVVEYLGIGMEEVVDIETINMKLWDDLSQAIQIVSFPSVQAAIATLQDFVIRQQGILNNTLQERDRLRLEIQEAQKKALLLAMEVDEQNYQNAREKQEEMQAFEQKWTKALKAVEQKARSECDAKDVAFQETKRMFEKDQDLLAQQSRKLKKEIEILMKNNSELRAQNEATNMRIKEVMEVNSSLKIEINNSKVLIERLHAIENRPQPCDVEQSLDLVKHIEDLVRVNKELKDRNEELEINMLSIPIDTCCSRLSEAAITKRKCPHILESPSINIKSKVLKVKDSPYLETPSADVMNEITSDNDEDINSDANIWCFSSDSKVEASNISESCNSLEAELDHVKLEIVKMMSEKDQKTKDANMVQSYETKISELEEQNKLLRKEILKLTSSGMTERGNQLKSETDYSIPDILVDRSNLIDIITNTDRSPPDGQERDDCSVPSSHSVKMGIMMEGELKHDEDQEYKKILEEKKYLEESLELMQTEFESMEDYWQKKIEGERTFYEEQLQVSESLFKELEKKMKESEDLLINVESSKPSCDKNCLYIIDEQQYLEEQVNEWQEEISELKLFAEQLKASHDDQIIELTERFEKEILFLNESLNQKVSYEEVQRNVCLECEFCRNNPFFPCQGSNNNTIRNNDARQYVDYANELLTKAGQEKFVCDARTQAPHDEEKENQLCSTSSSAFEVILTDISTQVSLLQSSQSVSLTDQEMMTRLARQARRSQQLHSTLSLNRGTIARQRELKTQQQRAEITQLESLVCSSQDLLKKQVKKFIKQMEKLAMADRDNEKLITDVQRLLENINMFKEGRE